MDNEKNEEPFSASQAMTNSPGSIQAGRDVIIHPGAAPGVEEISVAFLYQNNRLEIHNLTRTEFYLWGTRLADQNAVMEQYPRAVPVEPFHYFLYTDELEAQILPQTGDSGELQTPLYLFVEDVSKRKFTLKCLLLIKVENRQISIDAQNLGKVVGWLDEHR